MELSELVSADTFVMSVSATDRDSELNGKINYRLLSSPLQGFYIQPEDGKERCNSWKGKVLPYMMYEHWQQKITLYSMYMAHAVSKYTRVTILYSTDIKRYDCLVVWFLYLGVALYIEGIFTCTVKVMHALTNGTQKTWLGAAQDTAGNDTWTFSSASSILAMWKYIFEVLC